jgi:hypothetical protein
MGDQGRTSPETIAAQGAEATDAAPPAEEVRAELARLLASHEFRASRRCHDFLEFVVEQTLAGLPNGLKERTIGVQVFERPASYDTNAEGIVRIKASEVRKRLAVYYAGPGRDSAIRIELPVGSYVPSFRRSGPPASDGATGTLPAREHTEEPTGPTPAATPPVGGDLRNGRRAILAALAVLATLALVAAGGWAVLRPHDVIDEFWAPVLQSRSPVLVAAAYAPVYLPEPRRGSLTPARPSALSDFILLSDQYVGGGDLVAAARVTGMLGRLRHPYDLRVGHVTFEDLRNAPSVVIGYSSTQWAELTKDLRYFIDDNDLGLIRDGGRATDWYPRLARDYHTDLDYAIVSRAVLPQTHATMILITGCTQYGTEAAATVITSPALLAEALQGAPAGWQHRNLQLVLRLRVIAGAPAAPKVIASHYW